MKRVVIVGGAGRMGQALTVGLNALDGVDVVALVDVTPPLDTHGARYVERLDQLEASGVDAVVDFSTPAGVVGSAHWCATTRIPLVVGATGLGEEAWAALRLASHETTVIVASNFSVGAALAERFAALAAPYFDRVEIVELHHDRKADAPSGTSIATARVIAAARRRAGRATEADPTVRFTVAGARGGDVDGVPVHSVRLPGLVAHQEVLFGAPGEGLTIRHDSFDRASFVAGVALALEHLSPDAGLIEGITSFIDEDVRTQSRRW